MLGISVSANEQSEHIQPAWIAQSQNSKKNQVDIEYFYGESEHSSVVNCLCATVYNK